MASSLPEMAWAMERWSCETVCEATVGIVENAGPSCYNIDDGVADGVAVEVRCRTAVKFGRLAQLVRALPSHGRGQRFKSFVAHHPQPNILSLIGRRRDHRTELLCSKRVCLFD